MSELDGDYFGMGPTPEDLIELEIELKGIPDSERVVNFDPDDYELTTAQGNLILYSYEEEEDDEEEDDWDYDGDEDDSGAFTVTF